jgi:hypothetical protein
MRSARRVKRNATALGDVAKRSRAFDLSTPIPATAAATWLASDRVRVVNAVAAAHGFPLAICAFRHGGKLLRVPEGGRGAAYAVAEFLSGREPERPCEILVAWAREA